MSITTFPKQPPVTLRGRYEGTLDSICECSTEELLRLGPQTMLLELTVTLSKLKLSPGRLIPFPPVLRKNPRAGSTVTTRAKSPRWRIAAESEAIERWRKETTCRQKRAAMTAWMKRGQGATQLELMQLTGWRLLAVRAFIGSLRRKRHKVAKEKNASGECVFRLAE